VHQGMYMRSLAADFQAPIRPTSRHHRRHRSAAVGVQKRYEGFPGACSGGRISLAAPGSRCDAGHTSRASSWFKLMVWGTGGPIGPAFGAGGSLAPPESRCRVTPVQMVARRLATIL
jgi:hypothetical protein